MTVTVRPTSPDEIAAYRSSAADALAADHVGRGLPPEQGRDAAMAELAPGLEWALTPGHCAGHISLAADTARGRVVLCGRKPHSELRKLSSVTDTTRSTRSTCCSH